MGRACDRLRIRFEHAARNWEAVRGGRPVPGPDQWRHQSLPAPRLPYFPRPPGERTVVRGKAYTLARQTTDEAAAEAGLLDCDFRLVTGFPAQTRACGAISLRRHCPDQVLGVAVGP